MRPLGIHHVQVMAPPGGENRARAFYGDLLGLAELPKPQPLAARGGLWFAVGAQQLHVGLEEGFDGHGARAHVAFEVADLQAVEERLAEAGVALRQGEPVAGLLRGECRDPFGNRLELVQRGP